MDPTNLKFGLHYYEIYGVDCKSRGRGPIFRIPVTITKPMAALSRPPLVSFARMSFMPGHFVLVFNGLNYVYICISESLLSESF